MPQAFPDPGGPDSQLRVEVVSVATFKLTWSVSRTFGIVAEICEKRRCFLGVIGNPIYISIPADYV
jgi:hypothetical protein